MMELTKSLIHDVMAENPGALKVIHELMYFSDWLYIMKYLKREGIVGSKVWEMYNDEFKRDMISMGDHINEILYKEKYGNTKTYLRVRSESK